ncbi:MAG: PcfJ domain-containing protein [Hyphomicrobiaceae bacterium]
MRPLKTRPTKPLQETVAERRLRRLNSFPPPFRKYIAGLTSCAPAVEDLADSFPALLFAMSTGYGTVRRRQAAFEAVAAGHSLRQVAEILDLPIWLRRLPAQAMTQPLPMLPTDDRFGTGLLSRMPLHPGEAAIWFDRVLIAYRLVGREFAMWVMQESRLMPPHTTDEDLQWLLAWAWTSENPAFAGHYLLRGGWNANIGWKRSRDELAIWRKRIDLIGALAVTTRDPWFPNGGCDGLDIVGLNTVSDFINESAAMENCLDQYAAHLAYGRVRIFSVRKNGKPVANVEITIKNDNARKPCLSQIRGPRNRRAPPSIWQAVNVWLASHPERTLDINPTPPQATREAFHHFWRPYVQAAEAAGLPPSVLDRIVGKGSRRKSKATAADAAVMMLDDDGSALDPLAAIERPAAYRRPRECTRAITAAHRRGRAAGR